MAAVKFYSILNKIIWEIPEGYKIVILLMIYIFDGAI